MDPSLTVLYLAISIVGVFVIRSASMDQEVVIEFWEEPHIRQIVWLFITLIPAMVILAMDGAFFFRMAFPLYVFSLIILIIVMLVGTEINGARSWFRFGPIALQPSEFAKTTTSLAVAAVCALQVFDVTSNRDIMAHDVTSRSGLHTPTPNKLTTDDV